MLKHFVFALAIAAILLSMGVMGVGPREVLDMKRISTNPAL